MDASRGEDQGGCRHLATASDPWTRRGYRVERTHELYADRLMLVEQEPAVDAVALAELSDLQNPGEPDALAELVELFLSDAGPRVIAAREAIAEGNAEGVAQAAHALLGSCGIFGARPLARICERLQADARSANLTEMPGLLHELEREFARVRIALHNELRKA